MKCALEQQDFSGKVIELRRSLVSYNDSDFSRIGDGIVEAALNY